MSASVKGDSQCVSTMELTVVGLSVFLYDADSTLLSPVMTQENTVCTCLGDLHKYFCL